MSTTLSATPEAPVASTSEAPLASLYRACGTIGNAGMPGAPIAHFSLLVNPAGGKVVGAVHITQAIQGPGSDIEVYNVQGTVSELVWGAKETKVVQLTGSYIYSVPPPAIGTFQAEFTAHMVVGSDWNGQGGFSYGGKQINNVPVTSTDC
ncbi:DUF1842 domain-containing protein [Hymenobacter chitinivorans]|uniref:Uncharacterized protein DUF1842 n=1 Tax=Hymenobacter chitinivorans DSM 11115 TaxID=1121954 RepID=A0A2M9BKY4_9BACT|nr:DUF1842 domain-containing protein [Hymenobacter chitinivorans]PJJ58603.1 uncharacterized protein DUF1842 [Hymenobacter chitinivorans DSM 11115]